MKHVSKLLKFNLKIGDNSVFRGGGGGGLMAVLCQAPFKIHLNNIRKWIFLDKHKKDKETERKESWFDKQIDRQIFEEIQVSISLKET